MHLVLGPLIIILSFSIVRDILIICPKQERLDHSDEGFHGFLVEVQDAAGKWPPQL
jgi:hypothetical protein